MAWGSINPDRSLHIEVSWQLRGKINSWGEKKRACKALLSSAGALWSLRSPEIPGLQCHLTSSRWGRGSGQRWLQSSSSGH